MLKADLTRFIDLGSQDETVRVAAAGKLSALPRLHFDDHPVDPERLPAGWVEAMVAAWHATSSDDVRAWIAQAVSLVQPQPWRPVQSLMLDFLDVQGPYCYMVARFALMRLHDLPEARERLLALHRHRDPTVRSLLASRMRYGIGAETFDHAADAPILRKLMLDPDFRVRSDAVGTASVACDDLDRVDFEVLLDVVNMDDRGARLGAQLLIKALSDRLPGCTPEAFEPRVPLLRTDGVYFTRVNEVDPDGRWVELRCLRFLADGRVQEFGTDLAPAELSDGMPHRAHELGHGVARKDGAQVMFTIESPTATEDCAGAIDGCKMRLTRVDRATGRETVADYEYWFVDWDAPPPVPAPPAAKARGKAAAPLPFERPRAVSMIIADAAKWYLLMVARLPVFLAGVEGDVQRFERAWFLKNEMRQAAVKALFDPALKRNFFEAMPLPTVDEMLRIAADGSANPHAEALRALTTITPAERRAF